MIKSKWVRFGGTEVCWGDEGCGENVPVDVVVRPEDLYIFPVADKAQITGIVQSSIFKGVHYEMIILCNGYESLVQDYYIFDVGSEVGLLVNTMDILIMKKDSTCNISEGKLIDSTRC